MNIINALGRRKKSVARIYLKKGKGKILVNGRDYNEYFATLNLKGRILKPFKLTSTVDNFDIKVNVNGGGVSGQADAIVLAISRALCKIEETHRVVLKSNKLLTRDARVVERKKFGQKKARKKFQFSKR